ncbi:MAG: hypothetical protein M3063_15570 [Actinomycetota bacterium]|nr:hypothetical protein [Actinomycetota bacterium]
MRSTTWLPRRSGPLLGAAVAMACGVGLFLPGVTATASAAPAKPLLVHTLPSSYVTMTPTRVTDTRPASGFPNSGAPVAAGGSLNVDVSGFVPATATSVSLSVTAADAKKAGYLSVLPFGTPQSTPPTSVLNFVAGGPTCTTVDCVVPNLVVSKVAAGQVTIINGSAGTVDVVVDLEGYFDPIGALTNGAGHYTAVTPYRTADTRCAVSSPPPFCAAETSLTTNTTPALGAGGTLDVPIIPGIEAVAVQITATNTRVPSNDYLTAYATGSTRPLASNVNFVSGQTTSTRAIVPVDPVTNGITIFNFTGKADIVVDVAGYFSDTTSDPTQGSLYTPISPVRMLDTRPGTIGAGASLALQVSGSGGIPASANGSPTAAVLDVTEASSTTPPATPAFLTVTPDLLVPPATTSDVNFVGGETRANADLATLSDTGAVSIYNYSGTTGVAVDAFGYFSHVATFLG